MLSKSLIPHQFSAILQKQIYERSENALKYENAEP